MPLLLAVLVALVAAWVIVALFGLPLVTALLVVVIVLAAAYLTRPGAR